MNPKEINGNRISDMKFLELKEDNLSDKFPSFYWTPKLHKTPYKDRFIASSFDCTTKPLSVLLTRILSALKKLSNPSSVTYIRAGINEMWILKNSSELLQKIYSFHYPKIKSIQTFDFLTLYTPIPYQKLKDRIHMLVNQTFLYKNGSRIYKHFLVNGERTFFTNEETSACKITKNDLHTQLGSRKQVIAFQDRVITINIKEAQHPLKREKQVIDKSSIMLKISTKSMHRVLV